MNALQAAQTSIGAKMVMAVSGLLLTLFLISHMLGNLQVFGGQDMINAYGHKLRTVPGLLIGARVGLLTLLILHVAAAIRVTRANRNARPEKYAVHKTLVVSYAARTLFFTGVMIFVYVVYHLAHFTGHQVHSQYVMGPDKHGYFDVYSMVVGSFQNPAIAGAYIVAMLMLYSHLSHGIASCIQTLGFSHPRYSRQFRQIGPITAGVLVLGFILVPLSVQLGWVSMATGGQ